MGSRVSTTWNWTINQQRMGVSSTRYSIILHALYKTRVELLAWKLIDSWVRTADAKVREALYGMEPEGFQTVFIGRWSGCANHTEGILRRQLFPLSIKLTKPPQRNRTSRENCGSERATEDKAMNGVKETKSIARKWSLGLALSEDGFVGSRCAKPWLRRLTQNGSTVWQQEKTQTATHAGCLANTARPTSIKQLTYPNNTRWKTI